MTGTKIENTLETNLTKDSTGCNCDENNGQKKIENTRFSISGQILDIIENGTKFDIEDKNVKNIEKSIKRYIKNNVSRIENGENTSVFEKYYNKNENDISVNGEKINSKFEKYFPIHFPIIINKIKNEIEQLDTQNIDNDTLLFKKKNIIKNTIKKYSYIIYILGEKIKLGELIKFLNLDLSAISSLYLTVNNKIEALDKFESQYIEKIKGESKEEELGDKIQDNLVDEKIFATCYRNIFKKVISEGENVTLIQSLKGVSSKIEKLFKHSFENLFIIFSKWVESNGKSGEDLINIEKVVKKIMYGVNIFKKLDIAFNDSFNSNSRSNIFIYDINYVFLNSIPEGELKELFKKFISRSLTNGGKSKFNELEDQINDFKKRVAESKIPKALDKQHNIDLKTVDFDGWYKVPEKQKYELMFSEIIGKNGKITVSEYLNLEKLDCDLIGIFTESYGIDYQIVKEQLIRIRNIKNQTIQQFITNDINNLNLIIIWWRFLLKVRKLKKEGKSITIENITNIKETPYGVIEKISKKLKENKILESNKLNFKPEGKLNNISVETITEQLKGVIRGLKNGPFDLLNKSIIQGDKTVLIKDLKDLYILDKKEKIKEKKEELKKLENEYKNLFLSKGNVNEINEIKKNIRIIQNEILLSEFNNTTDWLNIGIDLCFNLLKNKKIENKEQKLYLEKLIKLNIVPKNYEEMNIKEFEKIQDLVETLKYIYSKRKKLIRMIVIGNKDKEKLEKELETLFAGEQTGDSLSGFGPQKSYTRAFGKLIKLYSGDFTQIGDLTRLRIEKDNINDLIDKLVEFIILAEKNEKITHISIIDNIGEPITDAKKKSGYRDIKLLFTFAQKKLSGKSEKYSKGGNVVELQFHYSEMLKLKEKGIDLHTNVHYPIFNKIEREKKRLTNDDIIELFNFARSKNIELPTIEILEKLMLEKNIYTLIDSENMPKEIFSKKKISATYLYDIRRQLNEGSNLRKKLTRLERVLSDNAWSKAVIEYLKNMGIQLS